MLEDLRDRSHHLLGNRYMAEVAAEIGLLDASEFTLTDIVRRLGIEKNLVSVALKKLESGGLIKRLPRMGQHRPFERVPSCYWSGCAGLIQEIAPRSRDGDPSNDEQWRIIRVDRSD